MHVPNSVLQSSVVNDEGWQHAGGELVVGDARLCFLVDLPHWSIAEYQHQWRGAISRLVQGAPSTALMTAYRGRGDSAHSLLAYPADYGETGVMTFMVNQDGLVWQRNLGPKTAELAAAITQFNPDSSWTAIPRDGAP